MPGGYIMDLLFLGMDFNLADLETQNSHLTAGFS